MASTTTGAQRSMGGPTTNSTTAATWLVILIFSMANIIFLASYFNKSNNSSSLIDTFTDLTLAYPPVSNSSEARELKSLRARVDDLTRELAALKKQQQQQRQQHQGVEKQASTTTTSSAAAAAANEIQTQLSTLRSDLNFLKTQHKKYHTKLKVHLWDDTCPEFGRREKRYFNREGWSAHPRTMLVDDPDEADIVVWVSVRSVWEREVPPRNYSNVILLDYADGCGPLHQKEKEVEHLIGYFKRSFVSRDKDSIYSGNCTDRKDVYPLAYSGIDALINRDMTKKREVLITNVLRTSGYHNTVRARILNWTKEFVENQNLQKQSVVKNVGWGSSGSNWDMRYKAHLENTKIIVTCNPWGWEGDFRLWESLLSGAMVMVDKMAIPNFMPHPFVHKKHLVYYDPRNQTEFDELLDYYVKHEEEARKIGEAGYQFVLDYHMPKDRVEYILSKIEDKLVL